MLFHKISIHLSLLLALKQLREVFCCEWRTWVLLFLFSLMWIDVGHVSFFDLFFLLLLFTVVDFSMCQMPWFMLLIQCIMPCTFLDYVAKGKNCVCFNAVYLAWIWFMSKKCLWFHLSSTSYSVIKSLLSFLNINNCII